MANFDDLTYEIATEFDLGINARRLVQEVLSLIASQPRRLSGFIDKFKAAGLEAEAKSWLGGHPGLPLSVHQIKKALGADFVKKIADDTGVPQSYAGMVLGYVVPKIVARLAPGGAVPDAASAISPMRARPAHRPSTPSASPSADTEVPGRRLLFPGAALVVTLGLFGYAVVTGTAGNPAQVQTASQLAQNAPPPPEAEAMAPAPALSGESLGDFAPAMRWVKNLKTEFDSSGGDAAQLLTAAKGWEPQETMPPAKGPGMIGSVPSAELPEFAVAAETGSGPADIGTTLSTTLASAQPASEQSATSVEAALQSLSIEFPARGTRIPSRDRPIVQQAADMIKQLPAGTIVELAGYPDPTGKPAAKRRLSERRAHSVYRALVRAGVNPGMLRAKGSTTLVPSTEAATEGRSTAVQSPEHNARRVAFRVIEQH